MSVKGRWKRLPDGGVGLALDNRRGDRVIVRVDYNRELMEEIEAAGPWRWRSQDRVVVNLHEKLLRRLVAERDPRFDPRSVVRQADPLDCRRASLEVMSRAEVALDTHRRRRA